MQSPDGAVVGTLHVGTNWVRCQRVGARVQHGVHYNNNWAFTVADNGRSGWINAV